MNSRSSQFEVLDRIAQDVTLYTEEHLARRGVVADIWMPSDFEGRFATDTKIPDAALVALVYNTLTEDGLPFFHHIIASYLGERSPWSTWNGIWTAEEARHGNGLRQYLEISPLNMRAYDELLFSYHVTGFRPEWNGDPYRLIAYTVMQEMATQFSHGNVGKLVAGYDPALARMLELIALDEGRHCAFYSRLFQGILKHDQERTLVALVETITSFGMPGGNIPGFAEYEVLAERASIFTTADFKRIVEFVIRRFNLAELGATSDEGSKALKRILGFPRVLDRKIASLKKEGAQKLVFPFLGGDGIVV